MNVPGLRKGDERGRPQRLLAVAPRELLAHRVRHAVQGAIDGNDGVVFFGSPERPRAGVLVAARFERHGDSTEGAGRRGGSALYEANPHHVEDLYFRLGAFVIAIPPLRDRPEDVPALVHDFLRQTAARLKKDAQAISSEAMTALVRYGWPGNVRELEHAIERAVILARGRVIGVRDLPPEVREPAGEFAGGGLDLKRNEPALIREALRRFQGNRRRAAAALNISPVTLWRKMKRFGIAGGLGDEPWK